MLIHSRTLEADHLALDQDRGKVDVLSIEAVVVSFVAPAIVECERNQLVWLARTKECPALEQATAVQIQDPRAVQARAQARQGVVQEAE
jgi:hypothetical protein